MVSVALWALLVPSSWFRLPRVPLGLQLGDHLPVGDLAPTFCRQASGDRHFTAQAAGPPARTF
jgi:hypothetical protein